MSETPAPAPLPPEEIERLKSLDAAATGAPWKALEGADHAIAISRNMPTGSMAVARLIGAVDTIYGKGPVVCISEEDRHLIVDMRNALPALLAEIEAGRAGAERVQELEAEVARLKRGNVELSLAMVSAAAADAEERAAAVKSIASKIDQWSRHLSDPPDPETCTSLAISIADECAALRQAAQPADGAQVSVDLQQNKLFIREMNRLLDAKGAGGCPDIPPPVGWDRECVKCAFKWRHVDWGAECPVCEGDITTPAAPAQVGAQPAGRVEAPKKTLAELQAELADVERQISECTSWGAGLAALDEWRRDLKRDIARATQPTAGASDDQENGR